MTRIVDKWICCESFSRTCTKGTIIKAKKYGESGLIVLESVPSATTTGNTVFQKGMVIPINSNVWKWEPVVKPTLWQRIKKWFADDGDDYNGSYD